MSERRMFTKKITDGDAFTEMPPTAQCLYFHLCMSADDDGFSNMIRQSMFNAHAGTDDFNTLVTKRFIIPFQSGVIVIKHWKMHNLIRSDRYHETEYLEEKATLVMKENGVYSQIPFDNQLTTKRQPNDNQMETEVRLGKDSIGKDNIEVSKDTSCPTACKPTGKKAKKTVILANVIPLPCSDGSEWRCEQDFYDKMKNSYPDVDIEQEFRSMCGWLVSNPKKTRNGMKRFVNSWLSKAQNSASRRNHGKSGTDMSVIDNWGR